MLEIMVYYPNRWTRVTTTDNETKTYTEELCQDCHDRDSRHTAEFKNDVYVYMCPAESVCLVECAIHQVTF